MKERNCLSGKIDLCNRVSLHNGLSRTVKIFKKIELGVSMARLTSNLVNASQIKWKKWKKDFEIGGIWTPDFH